LAVQLAAEQFAQAPGRRDADAVALFRRALEVLITRFVGTDAERHWRFFYAQLLDGLGEFRAAAAYYALVHPSHEHYVRAAFRRAHCLAQVLQQDTQLETQDAEAFKQTTSTFIDAVREFRSRAVSSSGSNEQTAGGSTIRAMLAETLVLEAETQILPQTDQAAQALDSLADFEARFPEESALTDRVWRVRLLAHERLGRFSEAARTIPAYLAANSENGLRTVQSLYSFFAGQAEKLRTQNDLPAAQRKAEMALVLARQLDESASASEGGSGSTDRGTLRIQLAEANLLAGRHATARDLFASLIKAMDEATDAGSPQDLRIRLGLGESLFQLGEFAAALPEFNRVATTRSPSDPARWQALFRDLQCRSALAHPPEGILKVIQQQRHLYPDLGGPIMAAEFDKLQRDAERRLKGEGPVESRSGAVG
jgi:hypothetical protein